MTVKDNLNTEFRAAIEKSTAIVNAFYETSYSYPVTVATNSLDIMKSGLLPWAQSGIRKTIIIRLPDITQNQITHEMSHYALRTLTANKPLPLWLDEGLACFVSQMDFIGGMQNLKKAYQKNILTNIISWKGLRGKVNWLYQMYVKKNTHLIYGQSFYLVDYLITTFGHSNLLNFIKYPAGAGFEESFYKSFGITQENFYLNFLSTLKS